MPKLTNRIIHSAIQEKKYALKCSLYNLFISFFETIKSNSHVCVDIIVI